MKFFCPRCKTEHIATAVRGGYEAHVTCPEGWYHVEGPEGIKQRLLAADHHAHVDTWRKHLHRKEMEEYKRVRDQQAREATNRKLRLADRIIQAESLRQLDEVREQDQRRSRVRICPKCHHSFVGPAGICEPCHWG